MAEYEKTERWYRWSGTIDDIVDAVSLGIKELNTWYASPGVPVQVEVTLSQRQLTAYLDDARELQQRILRRPQFSWTRN